MFKVAIGAIILAILSLFGLACSTLPSPQQPASRPMKYSPVNEIPGDQGYETAGVATKTGDYPGLSSAVNDSPGTFSASPGSAFDRFMNFGPVDWGHRKGGIGTSTIIVLVLLVVCVVGLAIELHKHPFI